MLEFFNYQNAHTYSLAATGIKFKSHTFNSRPEANDAMYAFIGKNGLHINKVYDDKHDKTYCCDGDVKFYIIRN